MKVGICSLGCKVNIYESEYVTNLLKEHNFEIVPFEEYADIYIINTCTVTNTSSNKSEKMINRARKQNKASLVVVMGCHSQIKEDIENADIIIGNKDKSKIVELISEYFNNKKKIKRIYNLEDIPFEDMTITKFNSHTRAFVKIEDGCDAYCSYCIIPYARGSIRSKSKEKVLNEITTLVNNGYKEIVLTGIHTGKYGKNTNYNLESLLKDIVKIPNLYRIRISSIEINEITDGIIELIKNNNIIARHLHIPIQSGSDEILKLMNRKYDVEYFINRINLIRKEIPNISITTDLIVGFPNETDAYFEETLSTLQKIKFTKIHTFPYSSRKNTPASIMPNQIDNKIKKERVRKVLLLSDKLENNFYEENLNNIYEVVIEQNKNNKSYGYTTNYIPIVIDMLNPSNQIVKAKLIKVDNKKVISIIE